MTDRDDNRTPVPGKRPPTHGDRNESRRVQTQPRGVQMIPPIRASSEPESWEDVDQLTPIAAELPDEIEVAAVRIEQRAEAIRERPGPTPAPEALQSAITIHGVRAELHEFKADVRADLKVVNTKIDKVGDKVDNVDKVVLTGFAKELDRRRDAEHLVMRQRTEIGTAEGIAAVEEAAARTITAEAKKKTRAETRSKIVVFLLSVATFVMALLEARHC